MRNPAMLATTLLLGACSLAPRHVRPEPPLPARYAEPAASEEVMLQTVRWQNFFVDARLRELITLALDHNRDLAIATARISEVAGLHRIQAANRLPTVNADAGASRGDAGANVDPTDRFSLSVGVTSFELDFWGRVRNLDEAAKQRYLATVEARRAFQLSLIGQVASTYLTSRDIAERIRLAEATLASRQAGLRIAERRLEAGVTSALDRQQATALLTQAEADLAGLRLAEARTANALVVLIGHPLPETLPTPLPLLEQVGMLPLAAGLPSDLLETRPDILASESELRAARADIGAARAAFFPTLSLTGLFGFASGALEHLISDESTTWNLGGAARQPLFAGGRVRANLTVAEAREVMAIASYERTVQNAFREVADALAGRRLLTEQVGAQERNTAAQRRIAELAGIRYREGVVAYLQVLDAERSLFASEQALLQLRRAEAENLVRLYLALGGGDVGARP